MANSRIGYLLALPALTLTGCVSIPGLSNLIPGANSATTPAASAAPAANTTGTSPAGGAAVTTASDPYIQIFPMKENNTWNYNATKTAEDLASGTTITSKLKIRLECTSADTNADGGDGVIKETDLTEGSNSSSSVAQNTISFSKQNKYFEIISDANSILFGQKERLSVPLSTSSKWDLSWVFTYADGTSGSARLSAHVDGMDDVTVPAGHYNAYKVLYVVNGDAGKVINLTRWYAAGVGLVREEDEIETSGARLTYVYELNTTSVK